MFKSAMIYLFTLFLLTEIAWCLEERENSSSSICSAFTSHPVRCIANEDTLQAVTIIFRNGERTPFNDLPGHNHASFSADGQLTQKGKKGSSQLGSFLKCRYANFLSSSPSPSVNVTSSNTSRTIETASAVLAALNIRNTPIHVIPDSTDNRLIRKESLCPSYEKSMNTYRSSAFIPPPELVELLSNVTRNVKTYDDVYEVYDTILTEYCQFAVPLPFWFSAPDLHPFFTQYFVGWVHDSRSARLFNGPLLKDILVSFEKGSVSMNLYSGHGVTISTMMEVMGTYDTTAPPPYNSFLIFELHKMGNTQEVRVLYGGDGRETPTRISLPWCPNPCAVTSFAKGMSGMSIDDESFAEQCKI